MKLTTKLGIGIAVLTLLSPLGLILPEYFKSRRAWGEWGAGEIHGFLGYLPKGLAKLLSLWNAPIAGYTFRPGEEKSLSHLSIVYIISAVIGVIITVIAVLIIGRILAKKGD